ncbi:MAG: dihydroneopterin aldolase [Saprospirales bacterium]|nr:MAG: dihydroneopterin aldolase [Saprospirales bacterium]
MPSIKIENARFFCHHGYYEEEAILGNEFSVDICVDLADFSEYINDQLDNTVNYENLYAICRDVMKGERKKLLESLAEEMCERIKSMRGNVVMIKVNVAKLNPPLSGRVDRSVVEYVWKS